MTWMERLRRYLEAAGAQVTVWENSSGLTFSHYEGSTTAPSVQLAVGEAELDAYLSETGPGLSDIFPDVSPKQAAYQLLLVHLDEDIRTCNHPFLRIEIGDGTLESFPSHDGNPRPRISPEELDSMPPLERLRYDLDSRGAIVEQRKQGLVIRHHDGRKRAPIIELNIGAAELENYLGELQTQLPEIRSPQLAYRRFRAHLELLILTNEEPTLQIGLAEPHDSPLRPWMVNGSIVPGAEYRAPFSWVATPSSGETVS